MEFAVMNLFPQLRDKSEKEIIEQATEQLVYAEELGFDSVWLAEHHFSEYGILGNPLIFAASLAAKTKRIRIGTAVMILPFYNPLRLAEDAAVVDILSNGRLELGIGRGYQPAEFKGFGIDQNEARGRFNETVEILQQAWSQGEVNFSGKYFHYEGVRVYPKPIQKPGIPLHFAAVSNDTFTINGSLGRPILTSPNFTPLDIIKRNFEIYRNSLTENGFDPSNYKFPLMQQVYVAESPEEAKRDSLEHSKWYYDLLATLLPGSRGEKAAEEYKFYEKVQKSTATLSKEIIESSGGNFGSPEEVIQRLKYMEENIGISQYICWFNFGQLEYKQVIKAMELFAKEVIPAFQK